MDEFALQVAEIIGYRAVPKGGGLCKHKTVQPRVIVAFLVAVSDGGDQKQKTRG